MATPRRRSALARRQAGGTDTKNVVDATVLGMATQGMDKYTDDAAARSDRGMLRAVSTWLSGASTVAETSTESHQAVWERGTSRDIVDRHGGQGEVEWQDTRTLAEQIDHIQALITGSR